jgi:hypothetical protein
MRRTLWALLAAFLGGLVTPAEAQQQLSGVQGTITDTTEAILPGVSVSIVNMATGLVRTTLTNSAGLYRVPGLEPGRYQVTAELAGFSRSVRKDVVLSVGATVGLNLRLEPGGLSETVDVAAVVAPLQTEKADVSAVVEVKKIQDLPLSARNVLQLASLQPGITGIVPAGQDFLVAEQGAGVNASGLRGSANNASVDGGSVNNGPWGGTFLIVPNAESVQEFQVISNNMSAEYGRNAGAAISIITKGGTNELHGSAFNFHRNDGWRTRNVFETTGPKPDFRRNDFGVSIGGPILKDRTFFFASYEGVRETTGRGQLLTVETEQFRDFVMRTRPGSNAAQLLQRYRPIAYPTTGLRDLGSPAPGANVIGPPDGIPDVGTISVAGRGERSGDQFNARLDHVFNGGRDKIRGTFYRTASTGIGAGIRPEFENPLPVDVHFLHLAHTHVVSPQTLNELTFGYARQHGEAENRAPESPTIGITGVDAGFGLVFWHPITFTQQVYEVKNTLTLNRGRHAFRLGGETRLSKDFAHLHHWERPNYTFQSILDFADDEPFSETRAVDPGNGQSATAPGDYRTRELGFFVQDNWKVRPNLTLNLGLRYDNFGTPSKSDGPFNGIVLGPGATRQEQMRQARIERVDRLYGGDNDNFGPRFGFAWDPASDGRWAIRGGSGLSYNRINNTVWSDERLNPPQFASASANIFSGVPLVYTLGPTYRANPALGRGLDERGGIRGARVDLRVVDPDIRTPYVYNWFLGVQRTLPAGFVAEANYIGTAARNLLTGDGPGGENYNRVAGDLLDGRLDRLNPSFNVVGLAESTIASDYHGLTLQLSRRYHGGFGFQAAYTLGKATDRAGVLQEVTRPELDEGPAAIDARHRIAVNVLWEIPGPAQGALRHVLGGWQVNAIAVWQTGLPFSVTCGFAYPRCDFNADGTNNERPNVPAFGDSRTGAENDDFLAGLFTLADFPLPAQGTFGTLGRNTFRGPRYFNTDLSIFKNVSVPWFGSQRAILQLRVEAFNVFDTVNLDPPRTNLTDPLLGRSTAVRFGTLTREVQAGVKFMF